MSWRASNHTLMTNQFYLKSVSCSFLGAASRIANRQRTFVSLFCAIVRSAFYSSSQAVVVGTGKQLQMNRMGVPHEEEGGGAETRVNVVPELPLLEARLDAPSLRTTDAEQTQVSQPIKAHID